MAQIDIGKIKMVWKGAWNSATAYTKDDAVSHSGSSYICIQAGTNQNPATATAYWELMAQAGTNGTNGTDVGTTITTQGDILYRDGSGLQRLAAGTNGQVLQTGGAGANPSWTTVAGGAFGQFVINTDSTQYSNTSQSTYVRATNTKVQITPSSSSKEILVAFNLHWRQTADDSALQHQIIRDIGGTETTVATGGGSWGYHYTNDHNSINAYRSGMVWFKDNPSTTSQCTYTVEFRNPHRTDTIYLNYNNDSQIMAFEIN